MPPGASDSTPAATTATALAAPSGAATTAGGAPEPLLRLYGISKRFGGVQALTNVSLEVAPGRVQGLIGPNGAGKTTLFDIVSGITPPTVGGVQFAGREVSGLSSTARARLGMRRTFQRAQVFSWLSVEDNVLAALEWHGGGGGVLADLVAWPGRRALERSRREKADEVLAWCGLADCRRAAAGSLPLGQQRLVELARAIVDEPRLLLLDEPTSGLDHAESERFGDLIQSLRGKGTAILLVEHDAGFVMRMCDRITVLNLGAVLAEGTPAQIQADEAVRNAYLG
ncbi:ABC transporter ATP-binding protein [Frankia sp. CNm7]|uniref:ABC transporter ATP-binding protein n=1 Tax=Frankia nepalensis TaxID=1836974 RepID=A0A937RAA6_9ACTN|nr:ABC transporter ATP-binding protein [Frankia nepalensis]MBL7500029.1 ABC transporter ATP-binding protein [Frankia nepalensis]MBL7511542.1 ABC transporter ATP-binding protein [Frankia nepalensis]MBL7521006.1 ABC transporter ATP-binding protein [Frankia nepalensis]MBL7628518.1 ABC transporter ATP-binding protein [Frankia nepalensis]